MLQDIQFTDKMRDVINDKSRVIFLEGVTGSGKSLVCSLKIFFDVFNLPADRNTSVLLGESTTTLERLFINNTMSIINLFPSLVKYAGNGQGGKRLIITTPTGDKYIYLVGFSNVKSQNKILGMTIDGLIIGDELDKAHPDFLSELFVRLYRNNGRMLVTSNGNNPDLEFYRDYMDKCEPVAKYISDVPQTTIAQMKEKKSELGYVYYFFGFYDNPKYTDEDIIALHNSVPKGSFRYLTKILGMRGASQGALFADLLTTYNIFVKKYNPNDYIEVFIALDMGSKNKNVVTATAINKNYKGVLVLDSLQIDAVTHDTIIEEVDKFISDFYNDFGSKVKYLFADDGLKHFLNRFNLKTRFKAIRCQFAIKPKHTQRVIYFEQALHFKSIHFVDNSGNRQLVKQLSKILTDGKGGITDDNKIENDYYDSLAYTVTPRIGKLLKQR